MAKKPIKGAKPKATATPARTMAPGQSKSKKDRC